MITSVRSRFVKYIWFFDSIGRGVLGRFCCACLSTTKIIAHDAAQNEPRSSQRALDRTADFRFPDARMIAHGNLNDAESGQGALQIHLDRPSVGRLLERKSGKHIGTRGAEWPQITDLHTIQDSDQSGSK